MLLSKLLLVYLSRVHKLVKYSELFSKLHLIQLAQVLASSSRLKALFSHLSLLLQTRQYSRTRLSLLSLFLLYLKPPSSSLLG